MYKELIKTHGRSKIFGYKFFGLGPNFIGFELELDKENVVNRDHFLENIARILVLNNVKNKYFIEHDSSLCNGLEFISQPHSIEEMRKFLNTDMTSILNKLITDTEVENFSKKAGFHIHISKTVFGDTFEEQLENVTKLWYFLSRYSKLFLKLGNRVDDSYCRFPFFSREQFYKRNKLELLKGKTSGHSKHVAINLFHKNTIEFRFFQSTTDINLIKIYIELIWHLTTKSKEINWKNVLKWECWFNNAPAEVIDYIKSI